MVAAHPQVRCKAEAGFRPWKRAYRDIEKENKKEREREISAHECTNFSVLSSGLQVIVLSWVPIKVLNAFGAERETSPAEVAHELMTLKQQVCHFALNYALKGLVPVRCDAK